MQGATPSVPPPAVPWGGQLEIPPQCQCASLAGSSQAPRWLLVSQGQDTGQLSSSKQPLPVWISGIIFSKPSLPCFRCLGL